MGQELVPSVLIGESRDESPKRRWRRTREEVRSTLLLRELIVSHGGFVSDDLGALIDSRPDLAREQVLAAFGHVPANPRTWAQRRVRSLRCGGL